MKPSDLLDLMPASEEKGDPLSSLETMLEQFSPTSSRTEKVACLDQVTELLAWAPLGSIDVFAPVIRQKLGVTKDTLRLAVQKARAACSASSRVDVESFEATPEELAAAEEILGSPRIEDRFVSDMRALGVVGETLNLILLLLVVISRLLARPICLALKSASSAGKSFLMTIVIDTLPPGECIVFTATSAKALYYRTDSLSHKVLVFMERPGVEDNDYQVRVLQSEGKLIYSVAEKDPDTGQIVSNDRIIEGPVAYIETTTQATLHDENETRLFSASLDESADATRQILAEQGRRASQGSVDDGGRVLRLWRAVHTMLRPEKVVIPFADCIARHFPHRLVRARRDFPRFLALIEASAVLYQHQRARDERARLVATLDDYALARRLAVPLLETALLGASQKTRELIGAARALADADPSGDPTSVTVTTSNIAKWLPPSGWSRPTIRRHLKAAEEAGYLDLVSAQRGKEHEYRIAKMDADSGLTLPSAEDLLADGPSAVDQPDQGASNVDDALNPRVSSQIAGVDHGDHGVRGQTRLFEENPLYRDPGDE